MSTTQIAPTTTEVTATLLSMEKDAMRKPQRYGASGAPYVTSVDIINGRHVEVSVHPLASESGAPHSSRVRVHLDKSLEDLTVEQAAEQLYK